jgi:hypothetical protein
MSYLSLISSDSIIAVQQDLSYISVVSESLIAVRRSYRHLARVPIRCRTIRMPLPARPTAPGHASTSLMLNTIEYMCTSILTFLRVSGFKSKNKLNHNQYSVDLQLKCLFVASLTTMPEIHCQPWIVQKYGGTSLGKLLDAITGSIIPGYLQDYKVAVICSARSRSVKSKGTTSALLDAVHLATESEIDLLDELIDSIKFEHVQVAQQEILQTEHPSMLYDVVASIEKDCEQLRSLLKAVCMIGEISERTEERVLAVGETLSCRIVSASLCSKVR